ncbi:hypothetical protein WA026_002442 [Henosepilachna vigintioctopunctata]|uniref:Neuroparsin n=1 Tax=Henosepilachna vigintioctopunctata TaxID=420089 RepID=A0AAW1U0S2_9CUCU
MQFNLSLVSFLAFVILLSYVQRCSACPRCKTTEECEAPPPTPCPYGEYINYCGRRACLKGPGEVCGGPPRRSYGECTSGTYCHKIGKCHGCAKSNMDCFNAEMYT